FGRRTCRSPDKPAGRIRVTRQGWDPGCASLIWATRFRDRAKRRGLIRVEGPSRSPDKATGRIRNMRRGPRPRWIPDALCLSGLRGYVTARSDAGWSAGEGPCRGPDKAAGRIGGPRQFPTLTRPPDALRLSGLRDFSALLERGRSTACARKHGPH